MKKIALILSTVFLFLSLGACSIIQSALPDQEVANLLGIDDTEVSAPLLTEEPVAPEFFGASEANLSAQAKEVWMPFFAYKSVADPEQALLVSPAALEQKVVFTSLTLTGGADVTVYPETIEANFGGFKLAMWDGFTDLELKGWGDLTSDIKRGMVESYNSADAKGLTLKVHTGGKKFTFSKDAANCDAASCTYTLQTDVSEEVMVLLESADAKKVGEILAPTKDDEDVNTVAVFATFKLDSDPVLDTGLSATVKVSTPAGVVKFK